MGGAWEEVVTEAEKEEEMGVERVEVATEAGGEGGGGEGGGEGPGCREAVKVAAGKAPSRSHA